MKCLCRSSASVRLYLYQYPKTEVINDSFFTDLLLSYGLSDRLALNLTLPFVYHSRSSMYEHGGNPDADDPSTEENEFWAGDRNTTTAGGLADIRLGLSYWLFETTSTSNLVCRTGHQTANR